MANHHPDDPDATALYVPIDLMPALENVDLSDHIGITISGLPDTTRLSRGRNNGDTSWSLRPRQLPGLYLIDRRRQRAAFPVTVRITRIDAAQDIANVLAIHEITIAPASAGLARPPAPPPGRRQKDQATDQLERLRHSLEAAEAARIAALEAAWESKLEQATADAREAARIDSDRRLKEAERQWRAQRREAFETLLAAAEKRWHRDAKDHAAAERDGAEEC